MADNRFEDFDEKAAEADPFKPNHSTFGWVLTASLFLLACGLWIFSGPNYIERFVLNKTTASGESNTTTSSTDSSSSAGDGTIPGRRDGEMALVFMNVKYGDGILIQAPDNTTSLIDGGEGGDPDQEDVPAYDWAYELYLPLFRNLGITELENLISTVPLSHHMGAQPDLVADDSLKVKNLYRTGYPASFYSFRRLELEAGNIDGLSPTSMSPGDRIDFGPGIKSQVLYGKDDVKLPDASSHVLYVKYGDVSFILMSDLPTKQEEKLVLKWADSLDANVIKVGKHGSRDATSLELLKYVEPSHAVISVSRRNPIAAPHDELMKRLKKGGLTDRRIYQTDTDGHIAFFTDGSELRIETGALSRVID